MQGPEIIKTTELQKSKDKNRNPLDGDVGEDGDDDDDVGECNSYDGL